MRILGYSCIDRLDYVVVSVKVYNFYSGGRNSEDDRCRVDEGGRFEIKRGFSFFFF